MVGEIAIDRWKGWDGKNPVIMDHKNIAPLFLRAHTGSSFYPIQFYTQRARALFFLNFYCFARFSFEYVAFLVVFRLCSMGVRVVV